MLDGDPATGWSNFYVKPATATLNAVSRPRPADWVSLTWPAPRRSGTLTANFVVDGTLVLPGTAEVAQRTARGFEPVRNLRITWGTGSNDATTFSFDPVTTTELRLTMTTGGFLRISTLTAR
jgi:beta-galactosidase